MASIKQQSTRQNLQEVSKANGGLGRVNQTQASSSRTVVSFYSDNKAADTGFVGRKSMPVNKACTLAGTSCQKGAQKSTEMSKSKNGCCGKAIAGRRALADVSNVQSLASRNSPRRSFKPSASMSLVGKTTNVSSKKLIKICHSQGVPDLHSLKKAGVKDLMVPSNSQNTRATTLTHGFIVANGRMTTRNSLISTRIASNSLIRTVIEAKSLPVVKRVNQADIPKEIRQALKRPKDKPIVKTMVQASDANLNTKSKSRTGLNKLANAVTATSKDKEPVTSRCETITQESICAQLPSAGDSKPSTSDPVTKKCSRWRRSYTYLLVEGSKLLEDHDVVKQEKLPSIDDEGNQLEVADYVDVMYQYYWITEAQSPALANYMSTQTDVSPHMRALLINWLIEAHFKFDLMQETLYLMVTLLDRYLSQVTVQKNEMQLVGLTTLLLASKYEDFLYPRVQDLLSISAEPYTRNQMLEMEKLILRKLKFRLNTPTPYVFMLRFLKAAQSDTKLEHLAFYLIECRPVEYEALTFKPSLLCASAIFVARCTLQMTPWTPLLCRHARYVVSQLRDCAEMILRFQQAARAGPLQVTYEKYMSPDLSNVAAIETLDTLPLRF